MMTLRRRRHEALLVGLVLYVVSLSSSPSVWSKQARKSRSSGLSSRAFVPPAVPQADHLVSASSRLSAGVDADVFSQINLAQLDYQRYQESLAPSQDGSLAEDFSKAVFEAGKFLGYVNEDLDPATAMAKFEEAARKSGAGSMEEVLEAEAEADPGPWTFLLVVLLSVVGIAFGAWALSKGYFEKRALDERARALKLKQNMDEDNWTVFDRLQLAQVYAAMEDYPAAIAELEEIEEDWGQARPLFDSQDALGALAMRADLHNSKGFCLSKVEPPRPAQARREYVRALTFWPENPEVLYNIASELVQRGKMDVADRTIVTALKWKPADKKLRDLQSYIKEEMEKAETGQVQTYERKQTRKERRKELVNK